MRDFFTCSDSTRQCDIILEIIEKRENFDQFDIARLFQLTNVRTLFLTEKLNVYRDLLINEIETRGLFLF